MDSAASEPEANRDGAAPRVSLGKGRALVPVPPAAPKADVLAGLGRSHGLVAAGVAAVMGLGFVAGTAVFASKPHSAAPAQVAAAETTADVLVRVQGEVRALKASLDGMRASADDARQADAVRGLKRSVDVLKQDLEGAKAASASAVGQLGAKLDKLDRDPGPKLDDIAARLDKLDRDPDTRIAQVASQLTARLDRIERQVASADPTGSIPAGTAVTGQAKAPPMPVPRAASPSPTGPSATVVAPALPPARPEAPAKPDAPKADAPRVEQARVEPPRPDAAARPAALDGWLLRDVYGGVALVEGRAGGLREVAPGEYVPGVGEIRSIERRGRGWVVVTSRGIIQADNRW